MYILFLIIKRSIAPDTVKMPIILNKILKPNLSAIKPPRAAAPAIPIPKQTII